MNIGNFKVAVMIRGGFAALTIASLVAAFSAAPVAGQEGIDEVTGKAILDHGAGQAVLAAGALVKAGKLAEVQQSSVREVRDEWAAMSVADQQYETAMAQERAPDPDTLEAEIARSGVLTFYGESARLLVPSPDERSAVIAFLSIEDGTWRVTGGPMTIDTSPVEESEPALVGAEILDHEIGRLVLAYAESIATGKIDEAMDLATAEARARRLAASAEERSESDRYLESFLPSANELAEQIRAGGRVFLEGEQAYLNVVTTTRTEQSDGTVNYSSSTVALPFALENGSWRIAD